MKTIVKISWSQSWELFLLLETKQLYQDNEFFRLIFLIDYSIKSKFSYIYKSSLSNHVLNTSAMRKI
jgi:nitrate reductase beta subunit